MIILEDSRQQEDKHKIKAKWFADNGIEVRRTKLYCGDYTLPTNQSICIDTKRNIQELVGNVIDKDNRNIKDKDRKPRFREELLRAQESGIKLIILVENENGITQLSELQNWINERLFIRDRCGNQKYPKAMRGITLMKACYTIQNKYGCEFMFCHPKDAGKMIIYLLTGETYE